MQLIDEIRNRLSVLEPTVLEISDDSAQHAGHKGNQGGGHFTLKIVSSHFYEKSLIIRHRLIYQTLTELMPHKIHALSIKALTPEET